MNSNLADSVNYISRLTLRKLFNVGKVLISYYWSKFTGMAIHSGMPISISFEPTTS